MAIGAAATPSIIVTSHQTKTTTITSAQSVTISIPDSMSDNYHQQQQHSRHHQQQQQQQGSVFAFAAQNGFQIPRDKQPQHGFHEEPPSSSLLGFVQPSEPGAGAGGSLGSPPDAVVYETTSAAAAGMLSEMFNFGVGAAGSSGASEVLDHRMQQQQQQHPHANYDRVGGRDRLLGTGGGGGGFDHQHHQDQISVDQSAMQLFVTNPQDRSHSSPPSHHHQPPPTTSALHLLLPNQQSSEFHSIDQTHAQFTWHQLNSEGTHQHHVDGGGAASGRGLSLSLSSTLQHLEATKVASAAEEIRIDGARAAAAGEMMFFSGGDNQAATDAGPSTSSNSFKDFEVPSHHHHQMSQQHHHQQQQQQQHVMMMMHHLQAGSGLMQMQMQGHLPVHLGFGSSGSTALSPVINVLRNSKYTRAAQELLEEFCSVGRGQFKKAAGKLARQGSNNASATTSGGDPSSSNAAAAAPKDPPQLSQADKMEHQRRKVKLLSMLDEVERRYSHYCEQMQMVVNSYDLVMGFGAAAPYTALAQKAMSRHFRCLKDAIQAQLKHSCELLGEKDVAGSSGLTKGETPRLKVLEQSLRQQRAFHQMGMMDQEAWRPQRGLPERSVNVLRAWLFEHFLHPYPSDADKHLLARQTGLSRNQVSNWFINARVRLWKPMIEDMYRQEEADREERAVVVEEEEEKDAAEYNITALMDSPSTTASSASAVAASKGKRHEHPAVMINASLPVSESDPSMFAHTVNNPYSSTTTTTTTTNTSLTNTATRHHQIILPFSENQAKMPLLPTAGATNNNVIASNSGMGVGPAANAEDFVQSMNTIGHGGGHHTFNNEFGTTVVGSEHHDDEDDHHHHHESSGIGTRGGMGPTMIRFGNSAATIGGPTPTGGGDVSLTLGLRHGSGAGAGGNVPEKNIAFSFRDFGS